MNVSVVESSYGNVPYYEEVPLNYEFFESEGDFDLYYHVYTEKMIASSRQGYLK